MSDLAPAAVLDAARAALAEITEAPGNRGYSHGALTDISDALNLLAEVERLRTPTTPGVRVGERVTAENVARLPIGAVVWWQAEQGADAARKIGPDLWEYACNDIEFVTGTPAFIAHLPASAFAPGGRS